MFPIHVTWGPDQSYGLVRRVGLTMQLVIRLSLVAHRWNCHTSKFGSCCAYRLVWFPDPSCMVYANTIPPMHPLLAYILYHSHKHICPLFLHGIGVGVCSTFFFHSLHQFGYGTVVVIHTRPEEALDIQSELIFVNAWSTYPRLTN